AIAVVTNTTTASLGTGPGSLDLAGALTLSADHTDAIDTTAEGKAEGPFAGGVALALNIVKDASTATTTRALDVTGAATFEATSGVKGSTTSTATAEGGQASDGDGSDVDDENSKQAD